MAEKHPSSMQSQHLRSKKRDLNIFSPGFKRIPNVFMAGGLQITYLARIKEGMSEHTQTLRHVFPISNFTTFIPFSVKARYIDLAKLE